MISKLILSNFIHQPLGQETYHIVGIYGDIETLRNWYRVFMRFPNGSGTWITMLGGSDRVGIVLGMPFMVAMRAEIRMREKVIITRIGTFGWGIEDPCPNVQVTGITALLSL